MKRVALVLLAFVTTQSFAGNSQSAPSFFTETSLLCDSPDCVDERLPESEPKVALLCDSPDCIGERLPEDEPKVALLCDAPECVGERLPETREPKLS